MIGEQRVHILEGRTELPQLMAQSPTQIAVTMDTPACTLSEPQVSRSDPMGYACCHRTIKKNLHPFNKITA